MKMEPPRLEDLALTILAEYVKKLSVHLLKELETTSQFHINKRKNKFGFWLASRFKFFRKFKGDQHSVDTCSKSDYALQVCNCLQTLLKETLPPSIMNEVSAKLLETLSVTVVNHNYLIDTQQLKPVVQELVNTVMPTTITKFHFTPVLCCLDTLICTRLASLKRLEELEFLISDISDLRMLVGIINPDLENLIMKALEQMPNLRTFRFPCYCTDNVAEMVVLSCPLIQRLDFNSSRVTEFGLALIARLSHLQELNVTRMRVTNCCENLLTNLADNNVDLKSFGCSAITPIGLDILINRFHSITCLNLVSFRCSLSPLKQFHNLRVLRLQSGCFSHIEEFIIAGHLLVVLELGRIIGVNVQLIGKFCLALTNLELRHCTILDLEEDDSPYPGFLSLKSVAIHTRNDLTLAAYIMSQCMNVRQATLYIRSSATVDCIESVLMKNKLTCLEKLTLLMCLELIPVDTIIQYIHNLTKLTVLKGVYSWRLQKEDCDKIIFSFPSLKFC